MKNIIEGRVAKLLRVPLDTACNQPPDLEEVMPMTVGLQGRVVPVLLFKDPSTEGLENRPKQYDLGIRVDQGLRMRNYYAIGGRIVELECRNDEISVRRLPSLEALYVASIANKAARGALRK